MKQLQSELRRKTETRFVNHNDETCNIFFKYNEKWKPNDDENVFGMRVKQ